MDVVTQFGIELSGEPRGDKLLVLPLVEATRSRIVLTGKKEEREYPEKGVVVQVGPGGVSYETGTPQPMLSKVGELVTYGRHSGLKFELPAGERTINLFLMREPEVLYTQAEGKFALLVHDDDPNKMHEVGLTCELCPVPDIAPAPPGTVPFPERGAPDADRDTPSEYLNKEREWARNRGRRPDVTLAQMAPGKYDAIERDPEAAHDPHAPRPVAGGE